MTDVVDAPTETPPPASGPAPRAASAAKLERYVTAWIFTGVAVTASVLLLGDLGAQLAAASAGELGTMSALVVLTALAFRIAVPFRSRGASLSVDLSEAALVAVFVLVPGSAAFLVACLGLGIAILSRRDEARKTSFNLSSTTVGAASALLVRDLLIGGAAPLSNRGLLAVAVALLVYGAVCFLAVSGVLARADREPLKSVVARRLYVVPNTVANIAIGTIGLIVWSERPGLLFLLAVPLLATSQAFRGTSAASTLTDRMRVEHDRLERVIRSTSDGIALVDTEGRVVLWSPALERLTSITEGDAAGASISHVLPLRDLNEHRPLDPAALLAAAEPGGPTVELDAELIDAESAESRVVRLSVTAVDEGGDDRGGLLVVRDHSREREVERLKDDFLMRVSHELRTPLTPIKGYAESLRLHKERVTPELLELGLKRIAERSDHMASLIDDLLLVASMQRGSGLARDAVPVPADAASQVRAALSDAGYDRDINVSDEATARAQLDPARFGRVMAILLDNAITYSDEDSPIDVVVRDHGDQIAVAVIDRGRGIPRSHLDRIFHRFHRVEDPLLMTTGGLGIGLHIARHLVRSMGGEITVESTLGEGSTFTVVLPRANASERTGASPS